MKVKPLPYRINIFYSQEDGSFIEDVPDLAFCSAHGATPEEALREVLVAQQLWLESAKEHGDPIPEATAPSGPVKKTRAIA